LFCAELRPPAILAILDRPIFKIVETEKQVSAHKWRVFQGGTHKSELHESFKISYVYDLITKSSRQQAEVYEIIRISMLASLDKENPNTKYIRG